MQPRIGEYGNNEVMGSLWSHLLKSFNFKHAKRGIYKMNFRYSNLSEKFPILNKNRVSEKSWKMKMKLNFLHS